MSEKDKIPTKVKKVLISIKINKKELSEKFGIVSGDLIEMRPNAVDGDCNSILLGIVFKQKKKLATLLQAQNYLAEIFGFPTYLDNINQNKGIANFRRLPGRDRLKRISVHTGECYSYLFVVEFNRKAVRLSSEGVGDPLIEGLILDAFLDIDLK